MHLPVVKAKLTQIEEWRDEVLETESANTKEIDSASSPMEVLKHLMKHQREGSGVDTRALEAEMVCCDLPEDMTERLIAKMKTEKTQFLNRVEISYAYGKLCEEWLEEQTDPKNKESIGPLVDEMKSKVRLHIQNMRTSKDRDLTWVDSLLEEISASSDILDKERKACFTRITAKINHQSIVTACKSALSNRCLPEKESDFLKAVMKDEDICKEYASLFDSWISKIDQWQWKNKEITTKFHSSLSNMRCHWVFEMNALDLMFIELIGVRMNNVMKDFMRNLLIEASNWKPKGIEGLHANEGRGRNQTFMPNFSEPRNWSPEKVVYVFDVHSIRMEASLGVMCLPSRVEQMVNAGRQKYGADVTAMPDGEVIEAHWPFFVVNSLVRYASFTQERPDFKTSVGVVSTDVKNCGLSVNHELVKKVMKFLGAPDQWIAFFDKILKPKFALEDSELLEIHVLEHGVVMEDTLSVFMRELPLFVTDLAFFSARKDLTSTSDCAPFLYRYHDDVYLTSNNMEALAKGYKRYLEIWAKLGLEPNTDKTAFTYCFPEEDVDVKEVTRRLGLPEKKCVWGAVVLEEDGTCKINNEMINEWRTVLQKDLKEAQSVISKIRIYNAFVGHLTSKCWSSNSTFDVSFDDEFVRLMISIHRDTFGPKDGIVKHLKKCASEKLDINPDLLPEGWFYWPMTAGGLALENPIVQHIPFRVKRAEVVDPKISDLFNEAFKHYYSDLVGVNALNPKQRYSKLLHAMAFPLQNVMVPIEPKVTDEFNRWKNAFEARLKEVFSEHQETRNYWAWIIANYGNEIRSLFGTFNFVETKHVSSCLIRMVRGG